MGSIMENKLQDLYDGWENEQIEEAKKRQRAIADRICSRIKKTTGLITTDELGEQIYVGDKLKVVEGVNCFNSGVVILEEGQFKINGDLLSEFLEGEYKVVKSKYP